MYGSDGYVTGCVQFKVTSRCSRSLSPPYASPGHDAVLMMSHQELTLSEVLIEEGVNDRVERTVSVGQERSTVLKLVVPVRQLQESGDVVFRNTKHGEKAESKDGRKRILSRLVFTHRDTFVGPVFGIEYGDLERQPAEGEHRENDHQHHDDLLQAKS